MFTKIAVLCVLVLLSGALMEMASAGGNHGHDDHDINITINDNGGGDGGASATGGGDGGASATGGGGGGGSGNDELETAGAAIAGAAGTCVRDWTKGMQYCASWAMVDGDEYDKAVHAFGGGVTTRVDEFALSFYGGVENLDKDQSTYMLTGSINWR